MRILSIDVGLLNLAYCIIELINNETNDFTIIDWGIINVSDEIKKCNMCKNPAKYISEGSNEYFCGVHKKKYKSSFNIEDYFTKQKEKNECIICKKTAYFLIKEGYVCSSHKKNILCKTEKSYFLKQIKKKNIMKKDVNILCEKIGNELDKVKFGKIDKVIIENQPVIKNPKMKTVQIFVSSYFIIRHNIDNKNETEIKFSMANNKLKYDKKNTKEVLSKAKNYKDKYCLNKQLSIDYAIDVLNKNKEKNKEWIDLLNNSKKKDDLSDALMQGYYFLFIKQ